MAEKDDRIAALREKIAACEAEADYLGLQFVAYFLDMAKRELPATETEKDN